ncbi:MAG: hypothetical protein V1850_03435 [Candidatus Bathyarchaeota archaeon]
MVKTIVREDGTEIEITDEEVGEIESEAVQKFREENPDIDKVDEYKQSAEDAQEKLAELENKIKTDTTGRNMSELRKQKEAAEKERDEAMKKVEGELKRVEGLIVNKTRSETMKSLIGEDEEMAKKVNHIYEVTLSGMPATNDAEIAERVRAAVRLAKPETTPETMRYEMRSSATSGAAPKIDNEDLSLAAQFLGADKIKQRKSSVEEMRRRRENAQ